MASGGDCVSQVSHTNCFAPPFLACYANGLTGTVAATEDRPERQSCSQSAPEILLEKIESTLPGQLGCGLVVPRRRVVVETMIDPLVNIRGVGHVICLER